MRVTYYKKNKYNFVKYFNDFKQILYNTARIVLKVILVKIHKYKFANYVSNINKMFLYLLVFCSYT